MNKAGTAALKYFLLKLFLISDKESDPDAESAQATYASAANGAPVNAQTGEALPNPDTLSEKQLSAIYACGFAAGLSKPEIAARSKETFQYLPEQLTKGEASTFIEQLRQLPPKVKGAAKPAARS